MIDNIIKIIRINAFIQKSGSELRLGIHKILCVALDMTCTFADDRIPECELTDEELDMLFRLTFGFIARPETAASLEPTPSPSSALAPPFDSDEVQP